MFKAAGALNHSERGCHLGKECCSKGKEKLIEALFYAKDETLTEATTEQIEDWTGERRRREKMEARRLKQRRRAKGGCIIS